MNSVIKKIRQDLQKKADKNIQNSSQRFFKEPVKLYGIKTPVVDQIGKAYFVGLKEKSKAEIFILCEELWKSGYLEESFIACRWSYMIRKNFQPEDFRIFSKWVDNYVNNWASCDTLCNHTIGSFLEMYPEYSAELKNWCQSPNRWMRRAAAVSLIIPARHGKFLKDIFELADILLLDKDDLVQKGYGWMLKSAGHAHWQEVFEYVLANKKVMPRTALRYAIEKMPKGLKNRAMH